MRNIVPIYRVIQLCKIWNSGGDSAISQFLLTGTYHDPDYENYMIELSKFKLCCESSRKEIETIKRYFEYQHQISNI